MRLLLSSLLALLLCAPASAGTHPLARLFDHETAFFQSVNRYHVDPTRNNGEHLRFLQRFPKDLVALKFDLDSDGDEYGAYRELLLSAARMELHSLQKSEKNAASAPALGENEYSFLLKNNLWIDEDPRQLARNGELLAKSITERMEKIAESINPSKSLAFTMDELADDLPVDDEQLFSRYRNEAARATTFVQSHSLMKIPEGFRVNFQKTPSYLRKTISIAGYSSGEESVVITPSEGDLEKMKAHPSATIPTIAVHEAVPGHALHYQSSSGGVFSSRQRLNRIRDIVVSPSLSLEGYAFYVEELMRQKGYFTPREELSQLSMQLLRAWRVALEPALHIGELSPKQTAAVLVKNAFVAPVVAQAEVWRYLEKPTQAVTYLVGRLQIEALKNKFQQAAGSAFTEARFHSLFFSFGFLPPILIGGALLKRFAEGR